MTFPDSTTQTTAWTGSVSSLVNSTKTVTLSTGGTLTANLDSALGIQTSKTLTTNLIIIDGQNFVTDRYVDAVASVIPAWSQRNSQQIEINLFVVDGSSTYTTLIGLPLGRVVIVTYQTASGNQSFTTVLSQQFTAQGQYDQQSRQRLSGRIDGTLPVGQTGIYTLNFPTYSTQSNTWNFDTNGKLTAPGNLQVDGGKIILNSAGNAYVESVDYGVNSANSAVNIFGGPYQKIKLRAGFGTEATWTFDTSGDLSLPNSAVIGQASDVEITAAATAYTDSLTFWAGVRASYQTQADNLGLTSSNWPFIAWNVTGPTATDFQQQLTAAWSRQNASPSSPPLPLIFVPPITTSAYAEIRSAIAGVKTAWDTWQALRTSVEITSGSESITLLSNGKLQVPNIIQTDPEEDLVIRTRYAVVTSPPGSGTYTNRDFVFGTNGNLTIPTGIAGIAGNSRITPNPTVSSKFFNFFVGSSAGAFDNSLLDMPVAENNKTVSVQFYHSNNTVGNLWNQGTDTIGLTNFNNAFNILGLRTDIKLTAQDSSSNRFTWTFDKTGILTVPGSVVGTATQNVFNTTSTTVNAFGAATTLNMGAAGGTTTIAGDLVVNGTTTTINSTTVTVDDKNIELGSVASPTNTTADGGGITLKGTTDKTIVWDNANTNWTASEHWNIASGKSYKINNVAVLSASAVLASATGVTVGGTGTTTIALGTNTTATNTVTVGGAIDGNTLKVAGTTTGTINLTTDVTSGTVNIFTSATGTITIGTAGSGIVGFAKTATTSSTASSLGYLGLPQSATNTSATLAIGDSGKHIYVNTASQTMTIPANGTVAYPIGTTLTFIAGPSATTVSIAITTDTMYLAGTGTTGTRTLAAHGMATAVKVAATTWYINGTGLT